MRDYRIRTKKGYNQYLIDYHVPEPFAKIEIPVKKRNPKLLEKFKE